MTPSSVEQVFLERRGGSTQVLLVLEDPAGARTRDRLVVASPDLTVAVKQAARLLAHRGIGPAGKVRLRVSTKQGLEDDAGLLALFLDELG